jgi:hypothetical protein
MSGEGVLTHICAIDIDTGIVIPKRIFVGGIPYGVSLAVNGALLCSTRNYTYYVRTHMEEKLKSLYYIG